MAKVRLHYVVVDYAAEWLSESQPKLLEGKLVEIDDPLLDGPVTRRLAIIDFDPTKGSVLAGARFQPPNGKRKYGRYAIADMLGHQNRDFQQVSVFTTVLLMMHLFEEPDVLGRKLRWAFEGEQLLVVPRAGRMANAFYHRGSRSLQFFAFEALAPGGTTKEVCTCLSPDIIAHEATHAILDGIAPDLFDATSPQALALHEAIADLGAVMFAVRTAELRQQTLARTKGDLSQPGAFNAVAEVFGAATKGSDRPLRDLSNQASLRPGAAQKVDRRSPHDLSTVLSGALYALLVEAHAREKRELADAIEPPPADRDAALFSASGKALYRTGERLKRMAFRALDFLPPGEISFADYGRAIIAADLAHNPDPSWEREFLKAEFVTRGIVDEPADLEPVATGLVLPPGLDLDRLVADDAVAGTFVEAHRDQLMLPPGAVFELRPRLDVTRTTQRHAIGEVIAREIILKVAWQQRQAVTQMGLAKSVFVTLGTTVVIDRETRAVRALLSTGARHPSQARDPTDNAGMRGEYLLHLQEAGLLDGETAEIVDGALRLRGLGHLLHVCGDNHV